MQNLPNVSTEFHEGFTGAGAMPEAYRRVIHLGCCQEESTATVGELRVFYTSEEIQDYFGKNNAVSRSMINYLSLTKQPQYGVRAATASHANASAAEYHIGKTGVAQVPGAAVGVIVFAGKANDDMEMGVYIEVAGGLGVGQYRWSRDNGKKMSELLTIPVGGVYEIPDTGITLQFTANTGFLVNTWYTSKAPGPRMDVAGLTDVLNILSAQTAEEFGIVLVLQGWAAADYPASPVAAEAAAIAGEPSLNRYIVALSFRDQNAGEAGSAWRQAAYAISDLFTGTRVAYGFGAYRTIDIATGLQCRRLALENNILIAVKARIGEDLGKQSLGKVPGVVEVFHDEAKTPLLYGKQWIVARSWPKKSGVYVAKGWMKTEEGSTLQYIQYRRIADEIERRLAAYGQQVINQNVEYDSTTGIVTQEEADRLARDFSDVLNTLLNGRIIAERTVTIGRDNNYQADKTLYVGWTATVPSPAEQIKIQGGFTVAKG